METATATPAPELRRISEVCRQTGLSKVDIYRQAKLGRFPKPIKIGERASAWIGSEVDAWVHERIAASRGAK